MTDRQGHFVGHIWFMISKVCAGIANSAKRRLIQTKADLLTNVQQQTTNSAHLFAFHLSTSPNTAISLATYLRFL